MYAVGRDGVVGLRDLHDRILSGPASLSMVAVYRFVAPKVLNLQDGRNERGGWAPAGVEGSR